jgi:hypothetical protein
MIMKKVRMILSLTAVLFAIGAAIASVVAPAQPKAYEFVADNVCEERTIECNTTGTYACRLSMVEPILRENKTQANCGQELKRSTAPPAN